MVGKGGAIMRRKLKFEVKVILVILSIVSIALILKTQYKNAYNKCISKNNNVALCQELGN